MPLRAKGEIPTEFLSTSTHKYLTQSKTIARKNKKYLKKAQREFFLQSNFAADELLLSGKVLFNDTLSRYIKKVVDVLLADEPELAAKLRFYVLKSPLPNAFTTHRGTIFINIGLMARLKNEAQLAYILAHEIAHFTNEHVLKRFVNDRETQRMWKQSQPGLLGAKLMLQNDYSRDSESEADIAGLNRMLKTPYHCSKITDVFDILNIAHKPYLPLKVDWHELTNGFWGYSNVDNWYALNEFKNNARSMQSKGIDGKNEQDTSDAIQTYLTTHPDPLWRKEIIEVRIPVQPPEKELFVVSKNDFQYLQAMAEYELCNLYLNQAAYFDALYQILALLEERNKDTAFLQLALHKTLYGIAKYRIAQKPIHSLLNYEEIDANTDQLAQFFQQFSAQRAIILAFVKAWEAHKYFPQKAYYAAVIQDLASDLFEIMPPFIQIKNPSSQEDLIFSSLFKDEAFQLLYEQSLFKTTVEDTVVVSSKKKRRKKEKSGYHLAIDRIVVFNPRYSRIDERPKQKGIKYLVSERHQASLDSYILSSGQDLDLEVVLLDTRFMAPESDAETFNDIALISDWHQEKIIHEKVQMITSNYEHILPLVEKYQTPYFVHMGAISMRSPIVMGPRLKWLALLVAPPLWPYGIYEMVKPREASMFYSLVYDLSTDRRLATMSDVFNQRMDENDLYDRIFEDLKQVKRKK